MRIIVQFGLAISLVLSPVLALNPMAQAETGKIAGRIWYDDNSNRTLDPGEEKVVDGLVMLLDAEVRVQLGETRSNGDGQYEFGAVAAGSYSVWVRLTEPFQPLGNARVEVEAGRTTILDFPTRRPIVPTPAPTGIVTGTVFYDRNENALLDEGQEEERIADGFMQWARPGESSTPASRRYIHSSEYTLELAPGPWAISVLEWDAELGVQIWGSVFVDVVVGETVVADIGLKPVRPRADWAIPKGHFFTQTSTEPRDPSRISTDFAVTDEPGLPFFSTFNSLPLQSLGYPISARFTYRGFPTQLFQKLALQGQPDGSVAFLNLFDELHEAGKDPWLEATRFIPPPEDTSADAGLSWDQVVARHLAILDRDPALREAYLSEPRWLELYGLPTGHGDYPEVSVVRGQRAAPQRWKVDLPWARAGEVTVANGGEIAREAGLFPEEPFVPRAPPAQ